MTFRLRRATLADVPALLVRTAALNAHEGIAVDRGALEAALRVLLADPDVGGVWLIEDAASLPVGYVMVTFGFDLEFAGRDAWLTEIWVDEAARGLGAGAAALALIDAEVRALGVRALHLQVRPDNPARRLYERAGFAATPRIVMTRRTR